MSYLALRVENLSKQYHIGRRLDKNRTLRDTLADGFTAPFRRAARLMRGNATGAAEWDDTIWALQDICFEVERGEAMGVIGRNGAGKSTLLKVLSRITEPTEGYAEIRGRVGSLLEVGTGFHPELTGRENIYLNGAILGMKRAEIDRKFDEIVAFAEVEKFIDTPVKHYSSGMRLRLGFAVAAHLELEILLVDEVLAVGDAAFQKKCLGKMNQVAQEGRTVLLVSHDMGAITKLCERALWLEDGQIELDGPAHDVVTSYLVSGAEGQATWTNQEVEPDREVQLRSVRLLSANDQPTAIVDFDTPFKIEIVYDVLESVRDLSITYHLFDSRGNLVFESINTDMPEWKGRVVEPGRYTSTCKVYQCLLRPGRYFVSIVSFVEYIKTIEHQDSVVVFDVSEVGYRLNPGRRGIVSPVFEWEIERTDGISVVQPR